MSKKLRFLFICISVLALTGFGQLFAQPQLTPPVAIGPQTLSAGFHEFLTIPANPSDDNGNIKGVPDGIAAGDSFWVYVTGIDASLVDIVSGGSVNFNLQDSEEDSSTYKHIGISFSLLNSSSGGLALLSCYQSADDQSDHGLSRSSLTSNPFDLRFSIYKVKSDTGWTITPEFRLSGGNWTEFDDGKFTPIVDFDFFGAKLVVTFEEGQTGSVSFDNYFVVGPIKDLSNLYVDDDWTGLEDSTIVQFPGEFDVRQIGVNAFATLGEALFAHNPIPTASGRYSDAVKLSTVTIEPDTIFVAPGTYNENVDIYSKVVIIGSEDGNGPTSIFSSANGNQPVIHIHGGSATGTSAQDRLEIVNLEVSGATGTDSTASGVFVDASLEPVSPSREGKILPEGTASAIITEYLYFENIVADDNDHSGIGFGHSGDLMNIELLNCVLSNNLGYGLYIASTVSFFDGLTVTGGEINGNGIAGLTTGPTGAPGVANLTINGTNFSNNGNAGLNDLESNDIDLYDFYGNATIQNVTVTGDSSFAGIFITGDLVEFPEDESPGAELKQVKLKSLRRTGKIDRRSAKQSIEKTFQVPPGNIILNNVTVNGTHQESGGLLYGTGIFIAGYGSGVENFSFTDVNLDVEPLVGSTAVNLFLAELLSPDSIDIGNTTFAGNADYDILNLFSSDVDAEDAIFTGAVTDFDIEDRVVHAIDIELTGLVRWEPDNVFLTVNSYFDEFLLLPPVPQVEAVNGPAPQATIVRALAAATEGDTVNVNSGTYMEYPKVYVQKDVVILGQGSSATIFQADGSTASFDTLRAWFQVKAGNTAIFHNLRFDGNSGSETTIHEAVRILGNGAFFNVDFRNIRTGSYDGYGILVNGDGIVDITDCTFSNIGHTGVYYQNDNADGSVYRGNTYTGKGGGEHLDYAVRVENGVNLKIVSAIISNNLGEVLSAQANDDESEATNGVLTIKSAGIKIVTDGPAITTVTIDSSDISNCASGIEIGEGDSDASFVLVKNSSLSGNMVGIFTESAQYLQAEKSEFISNDLGALFDDVIVFDLDFNELTSNNSAVVVSNSFGEIDDNIFHSNDSAVYISDQNSTGTTIHHNEFCDNSIAVENNGISDVDASGNFWGDPTGPNGAGSGEGDEISSGVDYTPFETTTLFANSPCEPPYILVETKAFLEGPYDDEGEMTSYLNTQGGIPTTSPYDDGRSVETIPENVVDWVYVELWEAGSEPNSANGINQIEYYPVTGYSAFLHEDGRIVADDGTTGQIRVPFSQTQALVKVKGQAEKNGINGVAELTYSYHIVIRHRNHLAIMSVDEVSLSNETSTLYDFSTGLDKTFSQGGDAMVSFGDGNFGMVAGDGNQDGGIDAFDRNLIWIPQNGTTWDYTKLGDFNLDGGIDAFDINLNWRPNNGKATQLPEIAE